MISGTLSFLFGILTLQQFSILPDINWCWGLIFLLLLPFLPSQARLVVIFIIGFLWALLRAHWVLDVSLPAHLQGQDVFVTGVIASIPVEDELKHRFEFDIETAELKPQSFRSSEISTLGKVQLSWYKTRSEATTKNSIHLKAGQRWQFWLRLKQPHGFMNPGGFDYEKWLYQKHIRATGYVRINAEKEQFAKKLNDDVSGYFLLSLRQSLYEQLLNITSQHKYRGILVALAMGERSGITQQQWQVFRATGTSHLVAISGLHIGLLAGFVFLITRRVWPYLGSAALYLAAPRAAAIAALLVASAYAALSGFAIPAQRALIMLFIIMFAIFQRHKVRSSEILSFALLCVLLLDPISVLSPGFWLSFTAVLIISIAAFGRLSTGKSILVWGQLQWRISLALIPLLVFLFQQASIISPLTNLVAIPTVSVLVVPLVLLASTFTSLLPDVSVIVFNGADTLLTVLWHLLSYSAEIPGSQWFAVKPDVLTLCLASIGFVLLLAPKGWPAKYWGLFLIIPLLYPDTNSPEHGEVDFTLLDVGQGLSAVIQTKHNTLVFDTGPKFSPAFNTGAAVVIPFLRQKGINKIDMLILSHKDNDHRGGFTSIRDEFPIEQFLSSYGEQGSKACFAGQHWQWDGVQFEILNPDPSVSYKKRNNASCVLRVSADSSSLLISADIEKKTENDLVQHYPEQLKATYLVVPHHGSQTSSSQRFLEAIKPVYALIPVGYRNRYRMPHDRVLQRYQGMSIPILKTSEAGAISVKLGQKSSEYMPVAYRQSASKYWNSQH